MTVAARKYHEMTGTGRRLLREEYVRDQDGLCWYCHEPLALRPSAFGRRQINWRLFPPGFLDHPVHLQHDHTTDLTEGAVHAYCNAVLWQYGGK